MAAKASHNPLDFLPDDEQVLLRDLFEQQPMTEQQAVEYEQLEQGWSIDLPTAFINYTKAVIPKLSTALANLSKSRYAHVYVKRVNEGGNFCGHDPNAPHFVMRNHPYFVPQSVDDLGDKRRSQILYDIVERIKAYFHDTDVIPTLHQANSDKRTSDRKRNSARREAIVNLLSVMILNMDLCSLRVGQPTRQGGFFNYSIKWLAKKAELSLSRAKRAMSDLNDSMIISSYQYRELINKERKEYIAHNAARVFDPEFFTMLEIDEQKLGNARDYAYKKQKQKRNQSGMTAKEQAVFNLNLKKAAKALDPNHKSLKTAHLPQNEDQRKQAARLVKKRNEVLFKLLEDHPELREDSEMLEQAIQQRFQALGLAPSNE